MFSVKQSYYKLARKYHPDRVSDEEKQLASEKFSIIHQAYIIICDPQTRLEYDKGSNVLFAQATVTAKWEHFLKPVTEKEVDCARTKYQNSYEEQTDIQRAYIHGNGSMTHIYNNVPFMRVEDEARVLEIIKRLISENKIPKLKIKKIVNK